MKSSTSCSEAPFASCWRIVLRRSSASSAFESAIVWFWHTRQRSSFASFITRLSSSVSSWAPKAQKASAAKQRTTSLLTLELPDERHDALLQHLRGHRADLLEADHALLVDHVGLRHAVHAVVDADLAVGIVERGEVRVPVAGEPLQSVVALVLVVEAVKGYAPALRELHEQRVLLTAGDAP